MELLWDKKIGGFLTGAVRSEEGAKVEEEPRGFRWRNRS